MTRKRAELDNPDLEHIIQGVIERLRHSRNGESGERFWELDASEVLRDPMFSQQILQEANNSDASSAGLVDSTTSSLITMTDSLGHRIGSVQNSSHGQSGDVIGSTSRTGSFGEQTGHGQSDDMIGSTSKTSSFSERAETGAGKGRKSLDQISGTCSSESRKGERAEVPSSRNRRPLIASDMSQAPKRRPSGYDARSRRADRRLQSLGSESSDEETTQHVVDRQALYSLLCEGTVKEAERAVEMMLDACDAVNGSYCSDKVQVEQNRIDCGEIQGVWGGLLKLMRDGSAVGRGSGKAVACRALGFICFSDSVNCNSASENGELLMELSNLIVHGHPQEMEAAAGAVSNMCSAWTAVSAKEKIARCSALVNALEQLCGNARPCEALDGQACLQTPIAASPAGSLRKSGSKLSMGEVRGKEGVCGVCAERNKLALRAAGAFLNISACQVAMRWLPEASLVTCMENLAAMPQDGTNETEALTARATMCVANMLGRKETTNLAKLNVLTTIARCVSHLEAPHHR